ncbi:MAG: response regulator transcription factor [Methanothrix sp.]
MTQAKKKIRLLICDDQSIVCEGLRAIFDTVPEVQLVGIAHNGLEAVDCVSSLYPDLVLMDLKMPEMDGVRATRIIREKFPETQVLILTTFDTEEWLLNAVRSGAAGYILKDTPREELVKTIIDTVNGLHFIDPQVAGKLLEYVANSQASPSIQDQQLINTLNDREREILQYLGRGYTNAEIAHSLFLTEGTIKNYVSNVLSKLGVTDRTQAAILAVRNSLE